MTADPPPTREIDAIVFDVGETLIDETALWLHAAELTGVPPFTLMGVLGGLAARGEPHTRVWQILGVERPTSAWAPAAFYPDALACLARLRELGFITGAVGNTPVEAEAMLRPHVDFVGSSARWGVNKPAPEFFTRVAAEAGVASDRVAYVGDRVDNDIEPAIAAGVLAIHIRRGPWGHLHHPPPEALAIRSLDELPAILSQRPAGTRLRGSRPRDPVGDVP
jgi:FMN phosphatase YigB (HAD superfamily)